MVEVLRRRKETGRGGGWAGKEGREERGGRGRRNRIDYRGIGGEE